MAIEDIRLPELWQSSQGGNQASPISGFLVADYFDTIKSVVHTTNLKLFGRVQFLSYLCTTNSNDYGDEDRQKNKSSNELRHF